VTALICSWLQPAGPDWLHEIKHDGFRLLAQRDGERVRLFTRNGHDWAERYPAATKALELLDVKSCAIDGEIVVCDERGLAVFDLLRHGHRIKPQAHLEDGKIVSRIFRSPSAPKARPWMYASGHNGDVRRAAHGYEPTPEAAMVAFAKSWRRE
jgi:hypothetical protein